MADAPFSIGIIQDRADSDASANLARATRLIREAAGRGAQIICLKELFNAPYFCKAQHADRFDLAEPIPGPTTDALQKLAQELAVVLIVPLFERQGPGVYRNSAAVIDADGSLLGVYRKMHIPDDPLFYEKYYFTPGDGPSPTGAPGGAGAGGFKVWKTRYATIGVLICWDQWYPGGRAHHGADGRAGALLPHRHRLASGREGRVGPAAGGRLAHRAARARDRQRRLRGVAQPHRPRGRAGHRRHHVLRPLVHRRSVRPAASPRPARTRPILVARCDPALIETVRRNWPFLRDRRVDAYGPILNRYLGA